MILLIQTSTGKDSSRWNPKRRMQSAAFGPTPGNWRRRALASLNGSPAILSRRPGSSATIEAVPATYPIPVAEPAGIQVITAGSGEGFWRGKR